MPNDIKFINLTNFIEPTYHTLIPFNSRTMAIFPTTQSEIETIIKNIKPNSNLNDILPINYIKECMDIFIEPITTCINKCFVDGYFPDDLKGAKIIPIFKSGDTLSMENYRPISILFDLSKIIEQVMFDRIYNYAKKFNLIDPKQFGFQCQSGTVSAAICLLDNIKILLDKSSKNIKACLFLDVSKACDTILRCLLMSKLYRYGFRGISYELINSYLSNRTQFETLITLKAIGYQVNMEHHRGAHLVHFFFSYTSMTFSK